MLLDLVVVQPFPVLLLACSWFEEIHRCPHLYNQTLKKYMCVNSWREVVTTLVHEYLLTGVTVDKNLGAHYYHLLEWNLGSGTHARNTTLPRTLILVWMELRECACDQNEYATLSGHGPFTAYLHCICQNWTAVAGPTSCHSPAMIPHNLAHLVSLLAKR